MEKQNYVLIGYHLAQANYQRKDKDDLYNLSIRITSSDISQEGFFRFNTLISFEFTNNDKADFEFECVFKVNVEGFASLNKEDEDRLSNILLPIVFPYYRSQIFSFTNDSLAPLNIPILSADNKRDYVKGAKLLSY